MSQGLLKVTLSIRQAMAVLHKTVELKLKLAVHLLLLNFGETSCKVLKEAKSLQNYEKILHFFFDFLKLSQLDFLCSL